MKEADSPATVTTAPISPLKGRAASSNSFTPPRKVRSAPRSTSSSPTAYKARTDNLLATNQPSNPPSRVNMLNDMEPIPIDLEVFLC